MRVNILHGSRNLKGSIIESIEPKFIMIKALCRKSSAISSGNTVGRGVRLRLKSLEVKKLEFSFSVPDMEVPAFFPLIASLT